MSMSGLSTSTNTSSSSVIELAGFRSPETARKAVPSSNNAQMLSMRRHLVYQASVEIDNLELIEAEYSDAVKSKLVKEVRVLLNKEFGKLRVHRYRNLYVIRHRSVEGLISSLLRVQFHAHQLRLPALSSSGKTSSNTGGNTDNSTSGSKSGNRPEMKPITLTWGVGRTTSEAEVERLRRRRQKMKR